MRQYLRSVIQQRPDVGIVVVGGGGLNAVKKAGELQPVLILMDVCLPTLDGIEATRRIQRVSPQSTILFVTTNYCLAEDALCSGVGFVLKSRAETALLPAVDAVL